MRIDFRPSVVECRLYERGGYLDRSKYVGSFVVHLVGETASLSLLTGMCGEDTCGWDTELDEETARYLKKHGITTVRYEHKGKQIERAL